DGADHAVGLEAPINGRVRKPALNELGAEPPALRRYDRRTLTLGPGKNHPARSERPREVAPADAVGQSAISRGVGTELVQHDAEPACGGESVTLGPSILSR